MREEVCEHPAEQSQQGPSSQGAPSMRVGLQYPFQTRLHSYVRDLPSLSRLAPSAAAVAYKSSAIVAFACENKARRYGMVALHQRRDGNVVSCIAPAFQGLPVLFQSPKRTSISMSLTSFSRTRRLLFALALVVPLRLLPCFASLSRAADSAVVPAGNNLNLKPPPQQTATVG